MQIRGLILFLLLSVGAWAQGGFYSDRAEGRLINGNELVAIPNATITVCADQACATPVIVYSDPALTVSMGSSFATDANGNFSFYAHSGQYFCQMAASGFSTAINPCQVSVALPNIANVIYVDGVKYSQADVFASANTAAATFGGNPGKVVIPPGSYSTASTLNCLNNIEFSLSGVAVTYTGTGKAISIQSVNQCKITGPLHLVGTKTIGTVGIYLGNPTANAGLTTHNEIDDVVIGDACSLSSSNGFGVGIVGDANVNSGTYYNVLINVASNGNLNQGWLLVPTSVGRFNSNRFLAATACHNGVEGFKIDGANFNVISGIDAEANGTYGVNFPGTQQTGEWMVSGGDLEGNGTADWNFGGGANVANNTLIGFQCGSTTCQTGWAPSLNNVFMPGNSPHLIQHPTGSQMYWGVGVPTGTGSGNPVIDFFDVENSTQMILGILRNGVGAGNLFLGTSHYPAVIGGMQSLSINNLLTSSTAPTIASGFGTSPSIVNSNGTAVFEVNVGTGGSATSGVLTMPAAQNGWICHADDMNTPTKTTTETGFTTTSVTLTAASAWTASDKLLIQCGAF